MKPFKKIHGYQRNWIAKAILKRRLRGGKLFVSPEKSGQVKSLPFSPDNIKLLSGLFI